MIRVRPARTADASDMAAIVNRLCTTGGVGGIAASDLGEWMAADPHASAWHVAIDGDGAVLGFQWIGPHPSLPSEAADIASFVAEGRDRLAIGSALFDATAAAAGRMGYVWINATIRADNPGALTYYQSRGFRVWRSDETGTISKRYDI